MEHRLEGSEGENGLVESSHSHQNTRTFFFSIDVDWL